MCQEPHPADRCARAQNNLKLQVDSISELERIQALTWSPPGSVAEKTVTNQTSRPGLLRWNITHESAFNYSVVVPVDINLDSTTCSRNPWLVADYGNHLRQGKTDKSWNERRKNTCRENTVVGEETAQRQLLFWRTERCSRMYTLQTRLHVRTHAMEKIMVQ
ncbi:hypothetical protein BU15DRAFT_61268 [Melanogaster broomeanus]|nr:hypothetical protein BU15DRAFT_61268 [Melanogaster broomeanus]